RLSEPRQHLQTGIAVGRLHADFLLEAEDGAQRVRAGAAVNAVGLETAFVQSTLDLLDLGQGRHTFAAGELAAKRRIAADQIAEMAERQRVAGRGIIGAHGVEVLPDQKGGTAVNRQPQADAVFGARKGNAVGAADTAFMPLRVSAPDTVIGEAMAAGRDRRLAAPGFAAAIAAARDEIARRAGQRIVRLAERIDAAVM